MAWTSPRTWADGEVVNAQMMNEQVRDNLNYLLAPNVTQIVTAAGTLSTTSTTFASLGTAFARSVTTNGGYLLVGAQIHISGGVGGRMAIGFDVDGVLYTAADHVITPGTTLHPNRLLTGLASGAHTVGLKWRVIAGTTTAQSDPSIAPLDFWAREA